MHRCVYRGLLQNEWFTCLVGLWGMLLWASSAPCSAGAILEAYRLEDALRVPGLLERLSRVFIIVLTLQQSANRKKNHALKC